jgi:hypothetical protein
MLGTMIAAINPMTTTTHRISTREKPPELWLSLLGRRGDRVFIAGVKGYLLGPTLFIHYYRARYLLKF